MLRSLSICFLFLFTVPTSAQDAEKIKILALGDSYTIGQSVSAEQRWPAQLLAVLEKNQINASVDIIAATGWTTIELEQAIASSKLSTPYDLVTLLIGVNDQFRGGSVEVYKRDFLRLLQSSISYVGGNANKVIVLSIPDYGVTPFARRFNPKVISGEIDAFNAVNQSISKRLQVNYVDITPISKQAQTNKTLLAFDGLHPSAGMYKQWVEQMLPIVEGILKKIRPSP